MMPVVGARSSRPLASRAQPSAQKWPAGHVTQLDAPWAELYVPGSQGTHATSALEARVPLPRVPGGQRRQIPSPDPWLPTLHGMHSSMPVGRPHPGTQRPYSSGPSMVAVIMSAWWASVGGMRVAVRIVTCVGSPHEVALVPVVTNPPTYTSVALSTIMRA